MAKTGNHWSQKYIYWWPKQAPIGRNGRITGGQDCHPSVVKIDILVAKTGTHRSQRLTYTNHEDSHPLTAKVGDIHLSPRHTTVGSKVRYIQVAKKSTRQSQRQIFSERHTLLVQTEIY